MLDAWLFLRINLSPDPKRTWAEKIRTPPRAACTAASSARMSMSQPIVWGDPTEVSPISVSRMSRAHCTREASWHWKEAQ